MNELVAAGSCSRFEIGSYEREVERYGGVPGMALAEQLFHVDSDTVVQLVGLRSQGRSGVDPTTLAVVSVESLLTALGMDATRRLEWCRHRVTDLRASGSEYRARSRELRALLGDQASSPDADLTAVLRQRRAATAPVAARLCELERAGQLGRPYDRLCDSLVHMHLNRLLGADGPPEELVLGLLRRVREGLARAPVVP
jgi:thiopeptide-type bacteriocin biosynthesis protein